MRKYIIETSDGDWAIWTATPWREATRRAPRVKQGTITLGDCTYDIDAKKMRRLAYKPWRFLKLITEYMQVQVWLENNPTPVELFSHELYGLEGRDDDRTGRKFAELSRSERLKRLVNPGTDWMTLLLLISVIGNVALGGAIAIRGK